MSLGRRIKHLVYRDYALSVAARHLPLDSGDRLLDVGGGGAYYMQRLAPRVRLAVLVDRFAGMYAAGLPVAHDAQADRLFSVVRADAHDLPFTDGCATKLFSNQVLEHLVDPARFFSEVARVLRPGGLALVLSQNATFLSRYRFPVRRVVCRVLPERWRDGNPFLGGGYEAWEQVVGHLHRFTPATYVDLAAQAGLEVVAIESENGTLSTALWECEAALMHLATAGGIVRVLSRGVLQHVTRRVERLVGGRSGLDLIGVFRKPRRPMEPGA